MKFKEKLHIFLERIKLSNSEYLTMKEKNKRFDNMLAAISFETNTKYIDVKDNKGVYIFKFPESKNLTISINVPDLMKGVGIVYDRQLTNINIVK